MEPLLSLGHLFWRSLHAATGWMGTTLLAVLVAAIQYSIEPRVEAWIRGQPYMKPETKRRLAATVVVAVITWVLLFGIGVVTTIYDDHVAYNQLRLRVKEQEQELKNRHSQLPEPEAPDSLRKRTGALADEWTAYVTERLADPNKPPDHYPNSANPIPSEEEKKAIEKTREFYGGIEKYYSAHFKNRFIGIIQEYKAVGVNTHFLESTFAQFPPYPVPEGSVALGNDALSLFRELAYHVDAKGHLLNF